MDWATYLKDYPAVVSAVVGLIGIVLGFFFGRWNSDRNRKLDRRAVIHDMRINQVRDYVQAYSTIINLSEDVIRILANESTIKRVNENMEIFGEQFLSLPVMMQEASKKSSSIEILNDDELTNLRLELFLKLRLPMDRFITLEERIRPIIENDEFDVEEIRKEFDLNELRDNLWGAEKIITKMQTRLDKLAQKVP